MEEHTRNWKFACVHLGVPAPGRHVRVVFQPIAENEVLKLAQGLREKLAEPNPEIPPQIAATLRPTDVLAAPSLYAQIAIRPYPPLHARIDRFGQTAILARWIHRLTIDVATKEQSGQTQAVSLYLTGLDRNADDCAISACRLLRFGSGKALPVNPRVFEQLRDDIRPLAIQIFCQSLARLDPSVRCGFLALGTAFFGSLGVVEPTDET